MAAKPETQDDWTETLLTRISPRASKILNDKLTSRGGISRSAWLRDVVYRELGITLEDKSHG